MMQSEARTISGRSTHTSQFPAMVAVGLVVRIGKVVGPGLAGLLEALPDPDDGDEADVEGYVARFLRSDASLLSSIVGDLFSRVSSNEAQALVRDLLAATVVENGGRAVQLNGGDDAINSVFTGDLKSLISTVRFVLEVNFRHFFDDASSGAESVSK